MSGIGKLGGVATKGITTKVVNSLDNALAKVAIKFGDEFVDVAKGVVTYGGKMISEGAEEYMQEILDPVFKNIAFNEKNKVELFTPEALYSGVLGAMSAGLLDVVPSSISDTAKAIKTRSAGKTALDSGVEIERLKELGQTFSADSVAYKIADRVNENTGAYTVGKLLNEIGAELTQQNQADVTNALVERGITQKHAETISRWLTHTVDGFKLNRTQRNALEKNEVVSEVFRDVIINKNSTVNQRRQNFFETAKLNGYTGVELDSRSTEDIRSDYNQKLVHESGTTDVPMIQNSTEKRLRTAFGIDPEADIKSLATEVANNAKSNPFPILQGKQTTTESVDSQEYDVSAEGKTILNTKNGAEDVEIKGVALTKGKEMTLELADGRKVSSKDITYRTKDEAIVYETVANMGVPTGVAGTEIALKKVHEVLGYDGVVYTNDRGTHEYVALISNQFKSAEPVTYDDNGNVIPLSERFNSEESDIRYSDRDYDKAFVGKEKALLYSKVKNLQMKNNYEYGDMDFALIDTDDAQNNQKLVVLNANVDGELNIKNVYLLEDSYYNIHEDNLAVEAIRVLERSGYNDGTIAKVFKSYNFDGREPICRRYSVKGGRFNRLGNRNGRKSGKNVQTGSSAKSNRETSPQGNGNNVGLKRSDRDPEALTPRNLLANALEESAVHEVEKKKLAEYKENIGKLYEKEQELYEIRKKIKELSFASGKRDTAKLKKLQDKAVKLSNSVTFYDKKLLNLESTSFLKNVLEREKKKAIRRQKEKDAERLKAQKEKALQKEKEITERYQASRKKAVESRNKTAMRNKIKRVVNELNQYLLHGTKDKHVMDNMKKVVAEALSILDMDTVGADERVERYNQLIAEATDPDVIASLTETRDRIQGQGDRLHEKLMSLKNAYADIINSNDPVIANAYDEVIENKILSVAQSIEGTSIRNMSLSQLEEVYDLYKMVLTNIRDSNKAFKAGKDETISELGYKVNSEVEGVTEQKYKISMFKDYISKYGWNELKPIYAFRMIGSDTFQRLFKNILRGQDTWYRDVEEGKIFQQNVKKKHGYNKWDFKKTYTFTAKSGKNFDLTLQQIMSLYAFSRREQALEHLVQGGIVFDSDVKVTEKVKGVPVKYKVNTADAFNLSPEIIGEIIDSLTPEQKSFVEEMQSFLSDTMGEKGNEVSLAMYGIKLYKEKFYFPLKSSEYYMNFTADEAGEVKLKNSGFSKETVKKANNPIVLSDFMDVWANHVNEMSTYHAFVLPIEDFSRVYNYRTPTSETATTTSLKSTLTNAFGSGVNKYIRQMLVDINGGARTTLSSPTDKITSLAKKGAVMLSASVVIQQPSAIARAMAYVKPKYFATVESLKFTKHNEKWQELKKYAPVAGIKEMGYFDTGMGRSSADWIVEEDYDGIREKLYAFFHDADARKSLTDDFLGKAPAMADELSWVALWEAVKKETRKETDLEPGTEKFLERCGERFTEVVELTQVYDSVLSRSGYMRDKGSFMKMATAFMAEPTVQANMLLDAGIQGKRNGKAGLRTATSVVGAVISSIVLNTLLKSIVYAARDDEEDETQWEKYFGAVVGDLTQSLNPLTMLPFVKDIVSIFSGYDVERMDMSLISDLKDSILAIGNETKPTSEKIVGLTGSIGQLFGVPIKNVIRDVKAVINTVNSLSKGTQTTKTGVKFKLQDEANATITGNILGKVFGKSFDTSGQKKYYDAVMSGDTVYAERMLTSFKNPKSSIVESLKKYEPRILEAAQAEVDGKPNERYKIAKEIVADGFKQDYVVLAIQSKVNQLTKTESESSDKKHSMSTIENYFESAENGNASSATSHKETIIEIDMYNTGKTYEEAEKSFFNRFYGTVEDAIGSNSISVEKAAQMLEQFGNLDSESAQEKAQHYVFKRDNPDVEYKWGRDTVSKYYEVAEPADISVEIYDEYLVGMANCKGVDSDNDGKADTGTKKAEKLEVIDSLPLSNYQKDVLYRMNGWSEKTLYKAPWH